MKLLTSCFLLSFQLSCYAQFIEPQVVASSGGQDNAQLNWTIGEVMIETYSRQNDIVTQGFHQTRLTVVGLDESVNPDIALEVFPNPTSDRVIVQHKGSDKGFNYELINANGQVVLQDRILPKANRTEIDMTGVANATYFLRVFSEASGLLSNYQIHKINN